MKMLLLLLLLLLFANTKSDINDNCNWLVEVVPFFQLMPAHRHYSQVLAEQLGQTLKISEMLQYCLRITVGCDSKVDVHLMRSLVFQGVSPSVYLWVVDNIYEQFSTTEYFLRGALVNIDDKTTENFDVGCWYVPFLIQNTSTSVRIKVVSYGVGFQDFQNQIDLDVSHLFQQNNKTKFDLVPITRDALKTWQQIDYVSPFRVHRNFHAEFTYSIKIGVGNYVFATFDFVKHLFVQFQPKKTNHNIVCTSTSGDIITVLLFRNAIFVATKYGLEYRNGDSVSLVADVCVSQIIISGESNKNVTMLLVSTIYDSVDLCGSLSISTFNPNTRLPSFTDVVDKYGTDIHMFCLSSSSAKCCPVAGAASASAHYLHFLVFSNKTESYYVIMLDRVKQDWKLICTIPLNGVRGIGQVELNQIFVHDAISHRIVYVYGTVIICCDSTQVYFITYADEIMYSQVTDFFTLYNEYFLFLTQDNELGLGKIGSKSIEFTSSLTEFRLSIDLDDVGSIYKISSNKVAFLYCSVIDGKVHFKTEFMNMDSVIVEFNYNSHLRQINIDHWQQLHENPCLIEEVSIYIHELSKFSGTKSFVLVPPDDNREVGSLYSDREALFLYQGVATLICLNSCYRPSGYRDVHRSPDFQWLGQGNKLFFESKHSMKTKWAYQLNSSLYQQVYSKHFDTNVNIPKILYLDVGDVLLMGAVIKYSSSSYKTLGTNPLVIKTSSKSVRYSITVIDQKDNVTKLEVNLTSALPSVTQHYPGFGLVKVAIEFRFLNVDNDLCFQPRTRYKSSLMIGCPPSKHLVFDWRRTLNRNKYLFESNYDCWKPRKNDPCFSFHGEFSPVLVIVDDVSGTEEIYKDPYIFLVIGGGPVDEGISLFTEQEIADSNYLNATEHHAIWRPSNLLHHNGHDEEHDEHIHEHNHRILPNTNQPVPIMDYSNSSIHWLCEWHSPCGNIDPIFPDDSQYDLLIEVSNRGLNVKNTYCDLTTRFVVRIHGLPASLIHKALPQLAITMGFTLIFFLFYHCFRVYRRKLEERMAQKE